MPTSLGPAEILVILVIALIVLGPKRLPEAGRQVGRFISEVRHWSSSVQSEIRDAIDFDGEPPPPSPTAAPNTLPAPEAPPVPSPVDLAPGADLEPATAPEPSRSALSQTADPASASEWGLPARTEEPAPEPGPAVNLPPEWATPPPSADG